ncbi:MAG: hypothetical protein R3Y56_05950 [Akkermansia sp.]
MAITIETRNDTNNASILAPTAQVGNVTMRPISLGSIELLRAIGNPLASGNQTMIDSLDTTIFAQFIWVHAAPIDEVVDTIYNKLSTLAQKVTVFSLNVSPQDLQALAANMQKDLGAIEVASAQPEESDNESPNAPTPL